MQILSEEPVCMSCKKRFVEASKEKWRLLPIHKVKDVLIIDVETKKKLYFGLFCGSCINTVESVKIKNA